MSSWLDPDKWMPALLFVLSLVGGGEYYRRHLRRRTSGDAADAAHHGSRTAKAQAETDYFNDAIERITRDRDEWRALCESERTAFRERFEKERQEAKELHETERKLTNDMREQMLAVKAQVAGLEAQARHLASNRALRLRLFRAQYPQFDLSLLESEPAPLDALYKLRDRAVEAVPRTPPRFAPDSTLEE